MIIVVPIYFSITSISGGLISVGNLSISKNFKELLSVLSISNSPLNTLAVNTVTILYTSSKKIFNAG